MSNIDKDKDKDKKNKENIKKEDSDSTNVLENKDLSLSDHKPKKSIISEKKPQDRPIPRSLFPPYSTQDPFEKSPNSSLKKISHHKQQKKIKEQRETSRNDEKIKIIPKK